MAPLSREPRDSAEKSLCQSLAYHVALPSQLPGCQESKLDEIDAALNARLCDSVVALQDLTREHYGEDWHSVRRMLIFCQTNNIGGRLSSAQLSSAFHDLHNNDTLIIHIAGQNAGLLVRRCKQDDDDSVTFEAFEASPRSEDVLASKNALEWDFPGYAVVVPYSECSKPSFQNELSSFLDKASSEIIERFAGRTFKAGSFITENRESVDPALITHMLMTLLEVHGARIFPPLLRKRVHDDVSWKDGSKPWRRSPFLLILKVGIQRHLSVKFGSEGRTHYKFLIALMIARLIDESKTHLHPELLDFLRAKLCRRLAKLVVDKERSPASVQPIFELYFTNLDPIFHRSTEAALHQITDVWSQFLEDSKRLTSLEHIRARPENFPLDMEYDAQKHHPPLGDMKLKLQNSHRYIQNVLGEGIPNGHSSGTHQAYYDYRSSMAENKTSKSFANLYFQLASREADLEAICKESSNPGLSFAEECEYIASSIEDYMDLVGSSYNYNPVQKSIELLTIMDLWVSMDKCATKVFEDLKDYKSGFPSDILSVLQLSATKDLCRLEKINEYLRCRNSASTSKINIFHNPISGCFAEVYFDKSKYLQERYEHVQKKAQEAQKPKEEQWRRMSQEHEQLETKSKQTPHVRYKDEFLNTKHAWWDCEACDLQDQADLMTFITHEHPLPNNPVQAKAVIFELACPTTFAAYRDTTWRILCALCFPRTPVGDKPKTLLADYTEKKQLLKPHTIPTTRRFTLASTTKSHMGTHFKDWKFPVGFNNAFRRNGLFLGYYDTEGKVWSSDGFAWPSVAHHVKLVMPSNSPFSVLNEFPEKFDGSTNGPSSYEVISSQTECPSGLNVHEYMAFQSLLSGQIRRFPQILVELGSSNINFSTEAATILMSHLIFQIGKYEPDHYLGTVHVVFRDRLFCERLADQIDQRLDAISSNWRETNCMETQISLIIKLESLGFGVQDRANSLVEKARSVTFNWSKILLAKIHATTDSDVFQNCSYNCLRATLLCKRTFVMCAEDAVLQPALLQCFIECSMIFQFTLPANPASLPLLWKNAIVRDYKMVSRMQGLLRRSLEANPHILPLAIASVWPILEAGPLKEALRFEFRTPPGSHDVWWVQIMIPASENTSQQIVDFNLREGHLLVNGGTIGKLPAEFRQSGVLQELFDDQSLLTTSSNLPGMTHMLPNNIMGQEIHFAFRNDQLIVRARFKRCILEYLPRHIFGNKEIFDLPMPLIEDCIHWLDVNTGVIEIRQRAHKENSNWHLNFHTRQAYRRTLTLVDPYSASFKDIARIFKKFEQPCNLIVYKPKTKPLTAELKRLELQFFLNARLRLESPELRSEIDSNQNIGTWHGLESAIVLRSVTQDEYSIAQRQRSVVVPLGRLAYARVWPHVRVEIENAGVYGRFTINETLGRIDCQAEPWLLYTKALLHAYTSFVLPDGLTSRTGTDEALHFLKSGVCQPWASPPDTSQRVLNSISKLTPRRVYYPSNLKVMQQVFWDAELSATIQHEGFHDVIQEIREKSDQLSAFSGQKTQVPPPETAGEAHLTLRNHRRRQIYQRPNAVSDNILELPDKVYKGRDQPRASRGRANVIECVKLIKQWPTKIHSTSDLTGIFQSSTKIGGYQGSFDKILLTNILDVDLTAEWGSLVNFCRSCSREDSHQLMFLFALMSFRDDANMDILKVLLSFCILGKLKVLAPPKWPSYQDFRCNQIPSLENIMRVIRVCYIPYDLETSTFEPDLKPKQRRKLGAIEEAYEEQQAKDSNLLAQHLLKQWPCLEPKIEGFSCSTWILTSQALNMILPEWERIFQNWELSQHLGKVQIVLDQHRSEPCTETLALEIKEQEILPSRLRGGDFPSLRELLCKAGPVATDFLPIVATSAQLSRPPSSFPFRPRDAFQPQSLQGPEILEPLSSECQELQGIIENFAESESTVRRQYGRDLMDSLFAMQRTGTGPEKRYEVFNSAQLAERIRFARSVVDQHFQALRKSFERDDQRVRWLSQGRLFPVLSPVSLLETLRSTSLSKLKFGSRMKELLVEYALAITRLQRLLRMEDFHQKQDQQKLNDEQDNPGHSNWNPAEVCDWLLLEIDSNILIRPIQIDVANAMIAPASGSNTAIQLNMGQGKTSCIIPMIGAVLANGKSLARVVTPKSLLLQTAQLLHGRLGLLLGREIRHLPFSRKTSTDRGTIESYWNIHKSIQKSCGVILAVPEHLLSFKLSGEQRLSDGRIAEANNLTVVQRWVTQYSRTILDECDHILAMRTQLIYPSGSPKTVEGHPHRWTTVQAILRLIYGHLEHLQQKYPSSLGVDRRSHRGFPILFFLRKDIEEELLHLLVADICLGHESILPRCQDLEERRTIKKFISKERVTPKLVLQVAQLFLDDPAAKQILYLLRGLLVHRILLMALKKRWNVQYGLHERRDPVAVPYSAKGTPSDTAEWGHPDVAILLTTLSFYYEGLSVARLRQSLEHVLKSDNPSEHYNRFTQDSTLPDSLKDVAAINVDDAAQVTDIWNHIRHNVTVVDYFLNNFVFPAHAKQFPQKLQASGWDVSHFSPGDKVLPGVSTLTTGFSGTNDSRRLLPLTIRQHDLPGLLHTNAEVLTYLLQLRNREYCVAANKTSRFSEKELLQKIESKKIRVLIDAGAQILESDNQSLVRLWMTVSTHAPAAVYFDQGNKPTVWYRHGKVLPLLATPYANDLTECLVYLDEAHCRGTDLPLGTNAKGALTLGPGVTKDHVLQAAMRLRQLARTQSVTFFAPPEVHQSIGDVQKKGSEDTLDSSDVIAWLLDQTCDGIEQLQPLYYNQGADFCRRVQAVLDNPAFITDADHRASYLESLRQVEQQTLEQLYGVGIESKSKVISDVVCPEVGSFMKELKRLKKSFEDSGGAVHGSALQEVEQEREVAYEIEAVRVLQKPARRNALSFPNIAKDIISFAKTGRLGIDSSAYEPAIKALSRMRLGRKYAVTSQGTSGKLFMSTEFTRTVVIKPKQSSNNFQRNVNWILYNPATEIALIVIPEEAEHLLPLFSRTDLLPTQLLSYAAPVTRKMLHFNDFKYYAVSHAPAEWEPAPLLRIELGILAGRLYFEFSEYSLLCKYLDIEEDNIKPEDLEDLIGDDDVDVDTDDEEVGPLAEQEVIIDIERKTFCKKPLLFLHEWLTIRRKGQDFSHTPMGYLCQGKPLDESHPFFRKIVLGGKNEAQYLPRAANSRDDTDDDQDLCAGDDVEDDDDGDFEDSTQSLAESGSDQS